MYENMEARGGDARLRSDADAGEDIAHLRNGGVCQHPLAVPLAYRGYGAEYHTHQTENVYRVVDMQRIRRRKGEDAADYGYEKYYRTLYDSTGENGARRGRR